MNKPLNVLYVEDDALDAQLMQSLITQQSNLTQSYNITHVESLGEALKLLKQSQFNAVLLDLELKDIGGINNISAIQNQDPEIPIIVLSGSDDDNLALQAIDKGAQDYLVKGYSNSKVINLALQSSIRRKSLERALFRQANYDGITELPNRPYCIALLKQEIIRAKRRQSNLAILYIDINHFKKINDQFGREIGNKLLYQIAQRLMLIAEDFGIVARYGGDEFIMILDDSESPLDSTIAQAVHQIESRFREVFHIENEAIAIGLNIGAACSENGKPEAAQMLNNADRAMRSARLKEITYQIYDCTEDK